MAPSRSGALPTVYRLSGRHATVGVEPTQLDGFLAPLRARGYSYTVLVGFVGVLLGVVWARSLTMLDEL